MVRVRSGSTGRRGHSNGWTCNGRMWGIKLCLYGPILRVKTPLMGGDIDMLLIVIFWYVVLSGRSTPNNWWLPEVDQSGYNVADWWLVDQDTGYTRCQLGVRYSATGAKHQLKYMLLHSVNWSVLYWKTSSLKLHYWLSTNEEQDTALVFSALGLNVTNGE